MMRKLSVAKDSYLDLTYEEIPLIPLLCLPYYFFCLSLCPPLPSAPLLWLLLPPLPLIPLFFILSSFCPSHPDHIPCPLNLMGARKFTKLVIYSMESS